MSYAVFQDVAIGLIFLWSFWYALSRLFPRGGRAAQGWLARHLGVSRNAALRALGARLMPRRIANGAGCGGGCASCGKCAPLMPRSGR